MEVGDNLAKNRTNIQFNDLRRTYEEKQIDQYISYQIEFLYNLMVQE
jgi:hypothetical protein